MWPDLADVGTVALIGSVAGALYPLTRVLLARIDRRHPEDRTVTGHRKPRGER
ncbi:hypothetical protein SEA_CARTHAGE_81 [Mycobacterium phage Carthage]|nr:hypothetical protein SEA_CARTHAGE_81 [Mycobacterium phage Carthage]